MLFNSLDFLIFFPIVVLLYYAIPHKFRYLWLLAASYYFYMCWNPKYIVLLMISTVITYGAGLLIARAQKKHSDENGNPDKAGMVQSKIWVAFSMISNLSILIFYKYFEFLINSIFPVIEALSPQQVELARPGFDILLPVGISFYTFQALGYTIDVYRGDVKAERNLFRYAVFISFFPQLVAGPIERSANLLHQFEEKHHFQFEQARDGLLMMLWGFFQKLVVADRVAILVNEVFDHYKQYDGVQIMVAMVFFAVQIYCDFAGYTNIAIGAAQVMGFRLMKNFDCPYFGHTVADFWRRWHISLTTWFTDYLYIPLGGSRQGKKKRYRNIMIVFLTSGLWHGASWHYVVWGGMNGLYQIIGYELRPMKEWFIRNFRIKEEVFSHKLLQVFITFVMVDIAWVFFRAETTIDAFLLLGRVVTQFHPASFFNGALYTLHLSSQEFHIALLAIFILFLVDLAHFKGMRLRESLAKQGIWFRYLVYIAAIFTVLIFGEYGPGFDASQFIYFQF